MVSDIHEVLLKLLREEPRIVTNHFRQALDIRLPSEPPAIVEATLNQITPTEYRADLVLKLGASVGIVVEVQLDRDKDKLLSWPVYLSNLRARDQCQAYLLVVTPSKAVAKWGPIRSDASFVQLSADRYVCGVREDDGRVECWSGVQDHLPSPGSPSEDAYRAISTNGELACGIRADDGRVDCWGNVHVVPGDDSFRHLEVGGAHGCGIREVDSKIGCVGDSPLESSVESYVATSSYGGSTCALRADDGRLHCWWRDPTTPGNARPGWATP